MVGFGYSTLWTGQQKFLVPIASQLLQTSSILFLKIFPFKRMGKLFANYLMHNKSMGIVS